MWCEECNEVAYCSRECREIDKRDHGKECDGRWTQKGTMAETEGRQRAASYARAGGFEPLETPPESLLEDDQDVSGGDDQSADKAPAERDVERQVEELKDSIIDLVLSARQRDEIWGEVSADAQQRHEDRCKKEAKLLEELIATFGGTGPARHSITVEQLKQAQQWARCCLEPWARQQREERLARRWRELEQVGQVRVRFRGIPATDPDTACALLVSAGICMVIDERHPVRFTMGQRRGSMGRVTVTEATVLLNNTLKEVWGGSRMVSEKRLVCEESQEEGEEEEQTDCTATLSPTNPYASEILQNWVQIWHILDVEEVDIYEIILLAVNCHLPDWRGEAVHNWSPSAPRPLRGVWEGTGEGQGQLRISGTLIPASSRNTHQLRETYAISNQQGFDERKQGAQHHLPAGAERRQRKEKVRVGIPCPEILLRRNDVSGDTQSTMLGAPLWLKDVQITTWWEPLVPGSAMERESSVCIRFEQLKAPQQNGGAMMTRQQTRSQLVEVLNKIQQVCGAENAPFGVTDIGYMAYINKGNKLEGIITLQKRAKETLEDDIAMGAMLAFHIGNNVQSATAQSFKWCPVRGEYGQTQCGVTAITAAHTWAGLSRRKMVIGTQRAGKRTWIIRDPKEGTIRRIIALLSEKTGDRTSLIARLATTPWSRKRQVMIKKEQPTMSSNAPEEEPASGGQARAKQAGKETEGAPQRPHSEKEFFCADWRCKWVTSLGRATNNQHRLSGSFRESMAVWLREQGDWNGSKAISEDWVLLERRAGEIARAQAGHAANRCGSKIGVNIKTK